ncbi:MAG: GNAT family N-acetyltransferase [Actinomycetota bacterium]|nr:GNAT family N-acetyltransferase [Actinomycetota bacterium]
MVAAHRDPLMRRWMRRPITTAEQARELITARQADRRAGRSFSFAVLEVDADGRASDPAGGVSLHGLADAVASGEVGYWVASHARGRGVAPRALNALCEWAFALPRPRPLERGRKLLPSAHAPSPS